VNNEEKLNECINPNCKLTWESKSEPKFRKGLCGLCFHAIARCKECSMEQFRKCNNNYANCVRVKEFLRDIKKIKKIDDFF
jgi:hypothetical protein